MFHLNFLILNYRKLVKNNIFEIGCGGEDFVANVRMSQLIKSSSRLALGFTSFAVSVASAINADVLHVLRLELFFAQCALYLLANVVFFFFVIDFHFKIYLFTSSLWVN